MWIGALGWLVVREYGPRPSGAAAPRNEVRLPPTSNFYALRDSTAQVGLKSITTDTLPDGLRVTSRTDVDVPLPVQPRRLLGVTEARYDHRFELRGFSTTASGEMGQMTLQAAVQPGGLLSVVVSGRGLRTSDTADIAVPADVVLPDAVPLALAARGNLRQGGRTIFQVLDPVDLTISTVEVRVGAESTMVVPDSAAFDSLSGSWIPAGYDTLLATRLSWVEHGLPVTAWVDRRGGIITSVTPLGLTQVRSPFEMVNSGYERRHPRSVQVLPLELPAQARYDAPRAIFSLGPVDLRAAAPALDTPWQTVADNTIRTRAGPAVRAGAATAPAADSIPTSDLGPAVSERVAQEARRIAARDSLDPSSAVRRLTRWVTSTIVPGTPSVGGAEQTLRRRRGDSSDRAALFVAMARALGIPARPVAGLLAAGGRIRYRAWAEVWLSGWVPVDPTTGQFPAGAGHLRLMTDATARPAAVVPLLGAIRPTLLPLTTTP